MSWFDDDTPRRTVPPKILRKLVWDRDTGTCKICGNPISSPFEMELAHDKASSKGGKRTLNNTFAAHSFCNRSQSTKSLKQLKKIIVLSISDPDKKATKEKPG